MQIPDPADKKPDGWDNIPAQIPDPEVRLFTYHHIATVLFFL